MLGASSAGCAPLNFENKDEKKSTLAESSVSMLQQTPRSRDVAFSETKHILLFIGWPKGAKTPVGHIQQFSRDTLLRAFSRALLHPVLSVTYWPPRYSMKRLESLTCARWRALVVCKVLD